MSRSRPVRPVVPHPEVAEEQAHLSVLYRRLDEVRERAAVRLAGVLDSGRGDRNDQQSRGTHQAASERDAGAAVYAEQLARYAAVENELCFGRLDLVDGDRRYVGRIGLFADTEDREPLLIDWRAPSARPFYVATPISPEGVVRRRQIHTRGRRVLSVDDEARAKALETPAKRAFRRIHESLPE